jgi:hypothetical protein
MLQRRAMRAFVGGYEFEWQADKFVQCVTSSTLDDNSPWEVDAGVIFPDTYNN